MKLGFEAALMFASSLLFLVGGLRAQAPARRRQQHFGAILIAVFGTAVVYALVVYAGSVEKTLAIVATAGLFVAAILYLRAYLAISTTPGAR